MIVYRHRRLDTYEVFYVGIGKTERRAYRKHSRNKHWHNIVNKSGYLVEILAEVDTWEEACELEMLLISEYGREDLGLGNLVNMTDGGDGTVGSIFSEEHKRKLSEAKKGVTLSELHKQKLSAINKGKKHSYDAKSKIGNALRGSKSALSKLTEQQAFEIKYCNFNSTQEEIAFIYGVTQQAISDIRNNRRWKHI